MWDLLVLLLPIALVDSFNPTATGTIIVLLATPRPVVRVGAAIAGFGAAYFAFGALVVLGADGLVAELSRWFASPPPLYYVAQVALALALLAFAARTARSRPAEQPRASLSARWLGSPWTAFGLGAALNIGELPTAFPYLAALERVAISGVTAMEALAALAVYAVIFVLPLVVILLVYLRLRERAAPALAQLNAAVERWAAPVVLVGALLLGGLLLVDSAAFFLRGEGLL